MLPGETVDFQMRMLNPDGSEAEMCGNGIRCFAKFLFDRGYAKGRTELPVETGAGLLHVAVQTGPDGKAATVRVDMGEPVLDAGARADDAGRGRHSQSSILPIEGGGTDAVRDGGVDGAIRTR